MTVLNGSKKYYFTCASFLGQVVFDLIPKDWSFAFELNGKRVDGDDFETSVVGGGGPNSGPGVKSTIESVELGSKVWVKEIGPSDKTVVTG